MNMLKEGSAKDKESRLKDINFTGIRMKLIIYIIVLIFVAIFTVSIVAIKTSSDSLTKEAEQSLENSAKQQSILKMQWKDKEIPLLY